MKKVIKNSKKTLQNKYPVFQLVLISFLALALLVVGKSFNLNTLPKIEKTADYGGIKNVVLQDGQWREEIKFAYFNNKIVFPPKSPLAYQPETRVLSAVSGSNKWVDITLSEQKLRAYEGGSLIYEFPISSGLPWTPTVTGDFNIWYKARWTRMIGGSVEAGNYYDLPNVPANMFFHGDYAMHGAYWHNNFGHPMSHGCVNMRPSDAAVLFEWTTPVVAENTGALRASADNPGTRVVVHD